MLLFSAGEVIAVAALTGLAGLLLGWLWARRRWKAALMAMGVLFENTLASADEVIVEQDRRLEMLESGPPSLGEPLGEGRRATERETPTGEIELGTTT